LPEQVAPSPVVAFGVRAATWSLHQITRAWRTPQHRAIP